MAPNLGLSKTDSGVTANPGDDDRGILGIDPHRVAVDVLGGLVDHSLARLDKGAWGTLSVEGEERPDLFLGDAREEHSGH